MIVKSYILKNLETLEKLYNSSTSAKNGLFYSKLAILELCGWIEESMDDIVLKCSNRKIKDSKERKDIKKNIVDRTYGFEYNKHFRPMLIQVIGRIGVTKLERNLDSGKIQVLQSKLSSLKISRNIEAHTHLKGITHRLDAPSVTKANFLDIYDGLMDIYKKLKEIEC